MDNWEVCSHLVHCLSFGVDACYSLMRGTEYNMTLKYATFCMRGGAGLRFNAHLGIKFHANITKDLRAI